VKGSALVRYVGAILFGFLLLYLLTRSSILIGDANSFLNVARGGDPAEIHYGEPGHLLQVPLARGLWQGLAALGLPFSLDSIFIAISLSGAVAANVFFGLLAAEILRSQAGGWLGAILFGTALNTWTQWNGELYGLALGFVTAGLFFALRGNLVVSALLWALSVLSHSEFTLAAPAFVGAIWMGQPGIAGTREKLQKASTLLLLAAVCCAALLLAASWLIGKWVDMPSLADWLRRSFEARRPDMADHPEVARALKGLLTAYTVAGHYWRDIVTGRGAATPQFLVAAAAGLLVIVVTGVLLVASVAQRRAFLLALAWLAPFHVLVNWWFIPTVEKYHAGALPGFVLLVTAGLLYCARRMAPRGRRLLYASYIAACAALNLFGAVLPMQALGRETARAEREIRQLAYARGGRAVFIACDDPKAIVGAGVEFLRLRSAWTGTVPEIERTLMSWTRDRLDEGKEPYVVGRWCLPEEWKTTWSKEPFDLFFLSRSFRMVPTRISGIPISSSVPTNPFNWTWGDVVRLERE
jgi:hypothetical protein